jgi:hypothetical protein
MNVLALLLSRLQFAFTVSFHIIFLCCLSHRQPDRRAGSTPFAFPVCSHRLRLCGVDDAGESIYSGWLAGFCKWRVAR